MDHGTARPVLVTGASSGIGNCVARYLAERGCLVYGTVRNDRAAADLRKTGSVVPLRCDVTKPAETLPQSGPSRAPDTGCTAS